MKTRSPAPRPPFSSAGQLDAPGRPNPSATVPLLPRSDVGDEEAQLPWAPGGRLWERLPGQVRQLVRLVVAPAYQRMLSGKARFRVVLAIAD